MIRIGLTGPSGAGKSLAASLFATFGIPSVNADVVYHEILARRDGCTEELARAFGNAILNEDGSVNRKKLGAAVFGKPETPALLHTLNEITHKYIMAEIRLLLQKFEKEGLRAAILDAPQLFEARAHEECDLVVGVLADCELRIQRIVERDGITREAALCRVNAQNEDDFFRLHCDCILENNRDAAFLAEQIRGFLIKYNVGLS